MFLQFKVLDSAYDTAMNAKRCSFDRLPHEILGIDINAECIAIKTAYQRLRFVMHPDKGGDKDKVSIILCMY
jgi:preprotein translocase subunit Sec63